MSSLSEFLVIDVGGRRFALAAAVVQTAVAPPPVTPLPFVPAHVEGLVNVNERVLPLIDLRQLLNAAGSVAPTSEVVVIESGHAPCALRVDSVVAKVDVDTDSVELINRDADTGINLVEARFEWEGTSVLVLDADALGRQVVAREAPEGRRGMLGRLNLDEQATAEAHSSCVVVQIAGETYGIALDDAIEILDLDTATAIPGAPEIAEGVAIIRDEALLVLSLARLLRRPDQVTNGSSVVVIDRKGIHYGLRVDAVEGIHTYTHDRLRAVEDESGEVSGIVIDENRVLGLLRAQRLVSDARHLALQPFVPARRTNSATGDEARVALLEVSLGSEAYGIPLNMVRRIAERAGVEQIRAADGSLVSGAVNIDGNVVPVVDFAAMLRLEDAGADVGRVWVIVGDGDREWAIPVREASDILDVPASAIEALDDQRRLVTAVARVDKRLISLLSMSLLLAAA